MEFVDKVLKCVECGKDFVFTAGEQLFFFDKRFKNDPKRCKPCKSKPPNEAQKARAGSKPARVSRTETRTLCSQCGIDTTVPFKPTQGRPVLCRQCFQATRRDPVAVSPAHDPIPAALLTAETPPNDLSNSMLPSGPA